MNPSAELYIYGRMDGSYETVANVKFMGFADSLKDVYRKGSILLSPAFLAGGVKTKVLECISFGCPVVGNSITFEGVDINSNLLSFTFDEIERLVKCPDDYIHRISLGTENMQTYCRTTMNENSITKRWLAVCAT